MSKQNNIEMVIDQYKINIEIRVPQMGSETVTGYQ